MTLNYTEVFIIVVALMIAAYDVFAVIKWGVEGTISRELYQAAQRWPIIPFVLGMLAGHLFWLNN